MKSLGSVTMFTQKHHVVDHGPFVQLRVASGGDVAWLICFQSPASPLEEEGL